MPDVPADYILLATGTSPPTPPIGQLAFYRGLDGTLYYKGADGIEVAAGGGGAHPNRAAHDTLGLASQAELDAHAAIPARIRLSYHVPLLSGSPWTNMPAALSFWLGTAAAAKHIHKVDLTGYSQVRLLVFKSTVAGAAAAKLILRYQTGFNQTVANYSDIGAAEVSVDVNVQNAYLDTGFINLVAGAKAEVFVALLGSGGNGTLDPAFGIIEAEFK